MTTATLFQTEIEAASTPVYPGVEFQLNRSGNRVIGSIRIEKPNQTGRLQCGVNYTRRANWTDEQEQSALQVAAHWFKSIGGMGQLANRQLGHIVSRLRAGHTEAPMHWAVNAYATSEWNVANRVWMGLGRFFKNDALDTWIDRSDEHKQACETLAKKNAARDELDLSFERDRRREQEQVAAADITKLPDEFLRQVHRRMKADEDAWWKAKHQAARKAWSELDPRAQSALIKLCRLEAYTQPGFFGIDTREEGFYERIKKVGMDNEQFTRAVYHCAFSDKVSKSGQPCKDLVDWPKPTQPWPQAVVEDEVRRRALLGCEWLDRHYYLYRGEDDIAQDKRACVEVKIQCFLDAKPFAFTEQLAALKASLGSRAAEPTSLERFKAGLSKKGEKQV